LHRQRAVNATARYYLRLYRGAEGAIALTTVAAIVQALLGLTVDPLTAQPVGLGLLHECSLEGREALLQLG